MFSYQEPDAPAIWTHILNESSDFRIEKSINRDYARRLACKVIHVYIGNITKTHDNIKRDDNARWKDVIYFDNDIINYALEIGKKRESCIDINKDLSPEQHKSKKLLSELKKIAELNYLTESYEYKRSLIRKISDIVPENEYYTEITFELKKLKNNLEMFNEQLSFLDINKLIALCVVYMRNEIEQIELSNTEKKYQVKHHVKSLIDNFLRPVYQAVNKALDFTGSSGLSKEIVESNFNTLIEYADAICDDSIKRSYNHKIEFTEYYDLEIQQEIDKIMDCSKKKYEYEFNFFTGAVTRKRERFRMNIDTSSNLYKPQDCTKKSYGAIPLKLDMPRNDEPGETNCFGDLITKFSNIIKGTIIKTSQVDDSESDESDSNNDFPYTFEL